jgi:hypothetical protein
VLAGIIPVIAHRDWRYLPFALAYAVFVYGLWMLWPR